MKSANCISAIGRIPFMAAPRAIPAMDASASGVSITRSSPNSSTNPSVAREDSPSTAHVLTHDEDTVVPGKLLAHAVTDRLDHGLYGDVPPPAGLAKTWS